METLYILEDMIGILVNMRGSSRNLMDSGSIRLLEFLLMFNAFLMCNVRLHIVEDHQTSV